MAFTTKWIKTGKIHDFIFVGKETIATATGNHVIFYNLLTKEERIEYFNSSSRGEGACCLAGHQMVSIFSTAERRCYPKIYVHTFPEIKKVAECKLDTGPNSYLSCCFSGTEYLVSLTSYPNFQLIVWLWRTGEKVHSLDTSLSDLNQTLEVAIHSSQWLYQFAPRTGELWTYEIYTYSKKITIIKNFIKLNEKEIISAHWMSNGNLLLSDSLQNVYVASADGKKYQLILLRDYDVESTNKFLIIPYNNIFLTVDDNSHLSCYSKSCSENNASEKWNLTWSIQCESHPLKMVIARHKEAILIYNQAGEILELDLVRENKPKIENIYNDCPKIEHVAVLEPDKVNVVAVDFMNCLHVIDLFTGTTISNFIINRDDQVMAIASHPHIPLVAVSTLTGKVMFFLKLDATFTDLKTLHVQREPLEKIRFARSGKWLGVSSTVSKYFFMLKTVATEKIDIIFHLGFKKDIVDFLIFENGQTITLMVLSQTVANVSNCIELYTIPAGENTVKEKRIILTNFFFKHLSYCPEKYGDFMGSPYLSKEIGFFRFEDSFKSISLNQMINSAHKIRKFNVSISAEFLLTSGFDGYTILRSSSDPTKVIRTFMAHHYQEKGTKVAVLSFNQKTFICLGNNGCLLSISFDITEAQKESTSLVNHKEVQNFLQNDKNRSIIDDNSIWLENELSRLAQELMSKSIRLKKILLEDLQCLKQKVTKMIDLNEIKSIECQIPTSAFDLGSQLRKEKVDCSIIRQEAVKERLQALINKKEGIINYLIHNFYDIYEVHNCIITSFDNQIIIKNYKICLPNKSEKELDFTIELFDIPLMSKIVTSNNKTVEEEMSDILAAGKNSQIIAVNESSILPFESSNDAILSGSTSYKYIVNDPPPNQLSILTFDNINSQFSREHQLKIHFNNIFDEMRFLKNKVLDETKQRLKLLNAYEKELKDVFGVTVKNPYLDESKWQLDESVSDIVTVKLENLSNHRSISILNSTYQTASRDLSNSMDHSISTIPEYVQLFREEKLTEMMDGLLEIRWEDEIKKEIPKPNCLLFKHPSKYNDEDRQAIAVYKFKVERRRIERGKYKTHLETQVQRINDSIKADIESFDNKMEEFALEKVKIQSAILQEFLLRLNHCKYRFLKDRASRKMTSIVDDLASLENENKMLVSEILKVEPVVVELRNKCDNLSKRDKALETKFRSEFSDLKQPLVEHLLRQYKRRPKISQISCASLTCLTEANKCLIAGKKSAILPQEYLDFLRGMDALDIMPSSLPPQIDGNHWQLLCKLRQNKVEMEIKVKVAAMELAEAEQTYFYLQKLSSWMQSKIYSMKNGMEEETLKQERFYQDSEIQLVLKSGKIEISLTGSIEDFEMAIVVTYEQLVKINLDIVNEGQKKIAAMQAAMFIRKSILYRRWKYQCMTTKLKHWQEQLTVLRNIKISKDMQNYLVERLERNIRYKDAASSGEVLNSMKKKFERMLKEEKKMLRRISKEIKYWREVNVDLANKIQQFESLKQHQKLELEETYLQKRNRTFHKHNLRAIMERTNLVEKLKESRNELLNLQTQLELLKLKTYPTLRFKGICHHRRSNNSMKS